MISLNQLKIVIKTSKQYSALFFNIIFALVGIVLFFINNDVPILLFLLVLIGMLFYLILKNIDEIKLLNKKLK